MQIPTVKINAKGGGFVVINESDFDEKVHELYADSQSADDKPKPQKPKTPKRGRPSKTADSQSAKDE